MFFYFNATRKKSAQSGFTLLELLVVITLLAVIAGVAIQGYGGVQDQGSADAVKFEMAEIRKALLQFRRDSGSQSLPGQKDYDCTDAYNGGLSTDPNSEFPLSFSASVAAMSNAEFITWCQAKDNFWMLFIDPFERPEVAQWDEDTHRGWHGPYLQNKYGAISQASVNNIPHVLDSYQSPYLLFDLSNDASASLVSAGENTVVGIITDCSSDDEDDSVVCLLR